jgi:3-oxoacyl-[acyl-carrier-protein] synthase III
MKRTKILAVTHAVPERVVTNKNLAASFDVTADELFALTGVKERRYIVEGEGGVQLALEATQKALDEAGIKADEIEMIIFACTYPDHQFPGNSAFLQAELGIAPCAILDVRNQGVGFLNALQVADAYIRNGTYRRILVAGADIHSTGLRFARRSRRITPHFGDAAGAMIVGTAEEGDDERTVGSIRLRTDARFAKDWYVPLGSIQHPRLLPENLERGEQYPVIHWDVVNREAVQYIPQILLEVWQQEGISPLDLDNVLAPNMSAVMIRRVYKASGIPEEKFISVKQRFGNTGAAGVPLGFSHAVQGRKLKSGSLIATVIHGSGLSFGAAIFHW